MKQLIYLLSIALCLSFVACGSDNTEKPKTDDKVEVKTLKGYEELDLSEWGFNLSLMVPNVENNGEADVVLTERGALEVKVGSDFGIEILYGDGDIELLKMDLKEDLVFTSNIVTEEENAMIYTQDIPESGVKTQHHFFYKVIIGTDTYEVRDVLDGEYGEGMIAKMLDAAKTLKGNKKVEPAV